MQPLAVVTLKQALNLTGAGDIASHSRAITHYLQHHQNQLAEAAGWQSWPPPRQAVLCLQLCCRQAGLNPGKLDGWWGPQTAYASEQLAGVQQQGKVPPAWRDSFTTRRGNTMVLMPYSNCGWIYMAAALICAPNAAAAVYLPTAGVSPLILTRSTTN